MNVLIVISCVPDRQADYRLVDMDTWEPKTKEEKAVKCDIENAIGKDYPGYYENGYRTPNVIDWGNGEPPFQVDEVVYCRCG